MLIARALFKEPTEACDPAFAIICCGAQHRVTNAGLAQDGDLRAVELLGTKFRRVGHMRIDQHRRDAAPAEGRRRGRAREPAARNQNIGYAHAMSWAAPAMWAEKAERSFKDVWRMPTI